MFQVERRHLASVMCALLFAVCAIQAECSSAPPEALIPFDWTIKETVMTRVSLQEQKQLNDFNICAQFRPPESRLPFNVFNHAQCVHRQVPGDGSILRIREERSGTKPVSKTESYMLSVAFPTNNIFGTFSLPATGVRIAYSDCASDLYNDKSCFVGGDATGSIVVQSLSNGGFVMDIDLMIFTKDLSFHSAVDNLGLSMPPLKIKRHIEINALDRK